MILVIDIGGTTIKYATIDREKNISNQSSIPTEKNEYNKFIQSLYEIYDSFDNVEGISIGAPGSLSDDGTSIGISAIPCIFNKNFKRDLEIYSNKRVEIENDANCSLLSELLNDKEIKDAVSIVIGTGIGGSIIANGELVKGSKGSAGEFGLLSDITEDDILKMTTISISQAARKYSKEFNENVNGKELSELQKQGLENANKAIDNFYRRLALLVMNIEFILNPEKVIISGAIITEETFLEKLNDSYEKIVKSNKGMFNPKSKIIISKYGPNSNLFGAAYNWFSKENK